MDTPKLLRPIVMNAYLFNYCEYWTSLWLNAKYILRSPLLNRVRSDQAYFFEAALEHSRAVYRYGKNSALLPIIPEVNTKQVSGAQKLVKNNRPSIHTLFTI